MSVVSSTSSAVSSTSSTSTSSTSNTVNDIDAYDEFGETDLFRAVMFGDLREVRRLLRLGASPDRARNQHDDNVSFRDWNKPINKQGTTPLHAAAILGHVEIARALIDHGANVEKRHPLRQKSVLQLAAYSGSTAVVELLVFRRARVTTSAVHDAAFNNHGACIAVLAAYGANIDECEDGVYAITIAARDDIEADIRRGKYELASERQMLMKMDAARVLLALNCNTDVGDWYGRVADVEDFEFARVLKEHQAKSDSERMQLRENVIAVTRKRVESNVFRLVHDELLELYLTLVMRELPPYAMLLIVNYLPEFAPSSLDSKILRLFEGVYRSCSDVAQRRIDAAEMESASSSSDNDDDDDDDNDNDKKKTTTKKKKKTKTKSKTRNQCVIV